MSVGGPRTPEKPATKLGPGLPLVLAGLALQRALAEALEDELAYLHSWREPQWVRAEIVDLKHNCPAEAAMDCWCCHVDDEPESSERALALNPRCKLSNFWE